MYDRTSRVRPQYATDEPGPFDLNRSLRFGADTKITGYSSRAAQALAHPMAGLSSLLNHVIYFQSYMTYNRNACDSNKLDMWLPRATVRLPRN